MESILPEPLQITLARGNVYLSREVCDAYFRHIESIALLRHESDLLLIPLVQQSAGGLLLKIRNLRGDRVVHAQEFWRAQALDESAAERSYPLHWDPDRAALRIQGFFPTPTPGMENSPI